ncbi:DNA adenine methylase [Sphingomonas sp. PR090111-T3T-6A]|uniref:DNA adenine methylase n=1 Tax=Sphingomonas sp. PR090111-T3T-6A TaxID=685778 RepID=UPI00035E20C8|nr:DNA adenine methylase [Sphingomonas sp. PR090111-T3T-6A]
MIAAPPTKREDDLKRPLLRWHGGKWRLAPWIIEHLPPHRCYVEPFGGAASVLLRKPRTYAEIYNDLDATLVNLFRVLRDSEAASRLIQSLELTPFARDEFLEAYQPAGDPVEDARRTIVRSFMGFGSDGTNGVYRTGFRANSNRSGSTPAHEWVNYPSALRDLVDRLAGVVIENRDAVEVMRAHDGPTTLHYVDPPYLPETRSSGNRRRGQGYHVYVHDMSTEEHLPLLAALAGLEGMVVLSGYPSNLYDEQLIGWRRIERAAFADGARERTEVLWINPAAQAAMAQPDLFEVAA